MVILVVFVIEYPGILPSFPLPHSPSTGHTVMYHTVTSWYLVPHYYLYI